MVPSDECLKVVDEEVISEWLSFPEMAFVEKSAPVTHGKNEKQWDNRLRDGLSRWELGDCLPRLDVEFLRSSPVGDLRGVPRSDFYPPGPSWACPIGLNIDSIAVCRISRPTTEMVRPLVSRTVELIESPVSNTQALSHGARRTDVQGTRG